MTLVQSNCYPDEEKTRGKERVGGGEKILIVDKKKEEKIECVRQRRRKKLYNFHWVYILGSSYIYAVGF